MPGITKVKLASIGTMDSICEKLSGPLEEGRLNLGEVSKAEPHQKIVQAHLLDIHTGSQLEYRTLEGQCTLGVLMYTVGTCSEKDELLAQAFESHRALIANT